MDNEITLGTGAETKAEPARPRRLVPMRVGEAAVYVEVAGKPPVVEGDNDIYAAAPNGTPAYR